MGERLECTVDQRDERGTGRCACSLVTATGGACKVFDRLPRTPPPVSHGANEVGE